MRGRSLVQGWLAFGGHIIGMGIRWITCFTPCFLFHFALHQAPRVSTSCCTVSRLFFTFQIPFLNCIPPRRGDTFTCWVRLSSFLERVSSVFLWSVLLACGRLFGLDGIEESRDCFGDIWCSLCFSLFASARRRFVAAGLLLPGFVWLIVAGISKIILLHYDWRGRFDLANQQTASRRPVLMASD